MLIGLIDVDSTNYPNIALMKISAYYKKMGCNVGWYDPWNGVQYDIVFMAKVFSFTPDYEYYVNAKKIVKGGTGYAIKYENGREVYHKELDIELPYEIEHIYPDYDLYPKYTKDTAFGFLTRGCPRGCNFCIVGKKESLCSVKVADLKEFWNGQKNIVLQDANILACKDWKELFEQIKATGAVIDFNQGLDIRLMTEEKARLIKSLKIKQIHFAWDRYKDKEKILPKFKMFAEVTNMKPHAHNVIVYTIVNFDTTFEQDLERIYTLRDLGYWAYVMIYDKEHCDKKYIKLSRWCNNRFVFAKVKRFEDYKKTNNSNNDQLTLFD